MTSSDNATRSGGDVRNARDATQKAACDGEISGTLESIASGATHRLGIIQEAPS
jgi:hypothetical protein